MRHLITLLLNLSFLLTSGGLSALSSSPTNSNACNCTVTQGENSYDLDFFSSDVDAITFYNYGVPFGSSANTGYEISNGMLIMIYENTTDGETSLILILDQGNDSGGGSATLSFNCLPSDADVILSDDGGEFTGSAPNILGNFNWAPCCTDGGIIDDIGCGNTFVINPDIGSGIDYFSLLSGDPSDPEFIEMEEVNCPIVIDCGGAACCEEAFEFTAVADEASCVESVDGQIDLTVECAADPEFIWSNGETTEDLEDVGPGFYTVTITDDYGCALTGTFLVGSGPSPTPTIDGPTILCVGQDDSIELTVEDEYDIYDWSSGDSDQSIEITEGGTYQVTVTDDVGCTGITEITVMEVPIPEPMITGPTETCEDIDIVLDAGEGYDIYDWSTGEGGQSIYVYYENTFSVTVTDEYGCEGEASIDVIAYPVPEVEIDGWHELCEGHEAILDAGEDHDQYNWSTGDETQSIIITEAGEYTVTVTNEFGCEAIDYIDVDPVESPTPVISGLDNLCVETEIVLSVDQGYDTYNWSSGDNGFEIMVTEPGTYSVTVTNSDDCEGVAEHIILDLNPDTTWFSLNSCNPLDTGIFYTYHENIYGCDSIEILTINFSESDSTVLFSETCNPLDTGIFVEYFINQFGCDSFSVENITLLPTDTIALELPSCSPLDTGTIITHYTNQYGCDSMVVSNTFLVYPDTSYIEMLTCDPEEVDTFQIELTNILGCDSIVITQIAQSSSDIVWFYHESCSPMDTGLVINNYTNQLGCDSIVYEQTFLLPQSSCLLDLAAIGDTISCEESYGEVYLTLLSGTPPFNYIWYDEDGNSGSGTIDQLGTTFEIDSLPNGQYTFEIFDPNGYSNIISVDIFQPDPILVNLGFTDISCFEANDGIASVEMVSGGIEPYNYMWSNNEDQPQIENLISGSYIITVTDDIGCEYIDSVSIEMPDALNLEYAIIDPDCTTQGFGQMTITDIEGGTKPYYIRIDDTAWSSGYIFGGLNGGDYLIELEDDNGCRLEVPFYIKEYTEPEVSLEDNVSIKAGASFTIEAEINIPIESLDTLYWEGVDCPNCTTVTVSPEDNSTYTVVMIDTLGCEARADIFIQVVQPLEIYTPNIFSPGRDGVNDNFTIYSNYSTVIIKELHIFNRWGDLVFSALDFPVNDPQYGWNGFFGNQHSNTGVFVYQAILELDDKSIRTIHGDVFIAK